MFVGIYFNSGRLNSINIFFLKRIDIEKPDSIRLIAFTTTRKTHLHLGALKYACRRTTLKSQGSSNF